MKLPTLYGRSTSGKVKQWSVSVLKLADGTCYVETEHGYTNGKKQLDQRLIESGKNIGRANETTVYEQACSEARSAYNKKVDEGYCESPSDIPKESDGMFLPMLAHRYDKHWKKIKYPCLVQPKLDGCRMIAKKEGGKVLMWTRKGKPITLLDNIESQLSKILSEGQAVDGEIYVHGWTFQRIISAVKKKRDDTDLLEYHIYDAPHEALTFEERMPQVNGDSKVFPDYCGGWQSHGSNIVFVETQKSLNKEMFDAQELLFTTEGYEGMMVRNEGSLYKYKHRSFDLQKVKRFVDDEFEIVGGKDGFGRESGLVIFKCKTKSGLEFDVRPRGSQESRREAFDNLAEYIGKSLTVRYQELTDDGVPRFPVGIAVRDYE